MRSHAAQPVSRPFGRFATRLFAVLVVLIPTLAALAERPSAMKLFPEESVIFVRVSNGNELGEKLQQTSTGRMMQDPQLKPFVEALYGKAGELYAKDAEGALGISWEDLKKLPKGEVAFAVVARPEKRPALLLMIDQGDEPSVADKLIDKGLDLAEQKGADFTKEKIGDVEVTIVRDKDRENRMFGVFERENTIVIATDPNVIRNVLWHWDHAGETPGEPASAAGAAEATTAAEKTAADEQKKAGEPATEADEQAKKEAAEFVPGRSLAQNDRFATIVKECRRPQDPPPQLLFYADPIELVRNSGRGSGGLQFVLGLFPALGIDGLMALGGTATFSTDEYDSLVQFHVQLENPRSGVMLLPAFQAGETAPQPFVPLALETYMTWNGSIRTTYDRIVELVDQYRYKGSVDKFVQENISDKLGIDFLKDVIDNMKGRYTWMIGFDRPAHMQGQQHILAGELIDEPAATESLKTVMKKYPELFEERHFGNVTYYAIKTPRRGDAPEDAPAEERPINPFVGIMDGYFFIGTSCSRFEECVAARDGTAERLVDSNDYVRTSAVIGRETAGVTPVIFSLARQEETFRQWYDLLTSEKTRALIEEHKEDNPGLQALADVMDQNKLPPFEVLAPYMAPGGGIFYDTDSGYHAISFKLRNEVKPTEEAAAPAAAQ
jgi:hypothetical protein